MSQSQISRCSAQSASTAPALIRRATLAAALALGLSAGAQTAQAETASRTTYMLDFSGHAQESAREWLKDRGFLLEQDAKKRDRFEFEFDKRGLVTRTKKPAFGMLSNEKIDVPVVSGVEVVWGVTKYPEGASYENGVNNEAVMLYVFLGDEELPSGSLFIRDSPYFIALFLCENDRVNHPYVGNYFKKGGRFVCVGRPKPGETVVSRFDLLPAYREFFDKESEDNPGISGVAISFDTSDSKDGGKAGAFIKRIRFSVFH